MKHLFELLTVWVFGIGYTCYDMDVVFSEDHNLPKCPRCGHIGDVTKVGELWESDFFTDRTLALIQCSVCEYPLAVRVPMEKPIGSVTIVKVPINTVELSLIMEIGIDQIQDEPNENE